MELWELVARERIRDTIALYNWSGDAYRLEDLTHAFTEDGVLEVRGEAPFKGRAAIIEFLGGIRGSGSGEDARAAMKAAAQASGIKRIVRHNIANIRFLELTPVASESLLLLHGLHRDRARPLWPLPRHVRAGGGAVADPATGSSRPTGARMLDDGGAVLGPLTARPADRGTRRILSIRRPIRDAWRTPDATKSGTAIP